jgi:hypothetical protein
VCKNIRNEHVGFALRRPDENFHPPWEECSRNLLRMRLSPFYFWLEVFFLDLQQQQQQWQQYRCLVCFSSRVFIEDGQIFCHECGERSFLEDWFYDDFRFRWEEFSGDEDDSEGPQAL